MTIFVTVVGTILSLVMISLFAYAISRKSFKYRNFFAFFAFFTMLFNGGLVPTYIVDDAAAAAEGFDLGADFADGRQCVLHHDHADVLLPR